MKRSITLWVMERFLRFDIKQRFCNKWIRYFELYIVLNLRYTIIFAKNVYNYYLKYLDTLYYNIRNMKR